MGLSYLTIILLLVVLCALPLYCELKTEESLNFDVMGETGDDPEAMRIKRGIQIINTRDDSTFDIHELKQIQKEKKASKQKIGDSKTAKGINERKPQSRDGKQRNLSTMTLKQRNVPDNHPQKSVLIKNIKSIGNKKSQLTMDGRNKKQKSVPQEMKNDKGASRKMIKSERKSKKSAKREIKLNTFIDLNSKANKREVGITNKTVNELEKNSLDKTSLSSDTDNNQEGKVDKSCAFGANDTILSGKNSRNNSKQNSITKHIDEDEEKSKEDDDDKEMKFDASSDKMKHKNGNKKYNSKNHKKAILQDKKSLKNKVARVKKTKLSRKKPKH